MNNPIVAKATWIIALRDQSLIKNNKMNSDLKAYLKKIRMTKQKQQVKLDKTRQKA